MTEIVEKIIWHKYPDEKPKLNSDIVAQLNNGEFKHTFYSMHLKRGQMCGQPHIYWSEYNPTKHCYEDKEKDIVAWAYELEGLKK